MPNVHSHLLYTVGAHIEYNGVIVKLMKVPKMLIWRQESIESHLNLMLVKNTVFWRTFMWLIFEDNIVYLA